MHIGSAFESGNIEVVEAGPGRAELRIRPDAGEDHFQWFHFRVTGAAGTELRLRIGNAGEASYPDGWKDYRACASYDGDEWFRVATEYDGTALTLVHTPDVDTVHYAYFAPYSLQRHADLVGAAACAPGVTCQRLGSTVDGRDLDLLRVEAPGSGDGERRLRCWIIARQHPGESMAEWLMEGLVEHLLDPDEPVARALLRRCTFFLVPNMNPDGSARGHLRNNASGRNLNRQWLDPSPEASPEVFLVRRAMEETGVDFFLDVHGDEALPYNFIAGAEGTPSWSSAKAERQARYAARLQALNPDFQTTHGYPKSPQGKANMTMATNWVGERFDCLAMTLEQPFKDTADTPHPRGWTPQRAKLLGRDQLPTLLQTLDELR